MRFTRFSGQSGIHPPTASLTGILAQKGVLRDGEINAATGQYLQLANQWSNLAENALPSIIPVFDRVKKMLNNPYLTYRLNDFTTYQTIIEDLNILAKTLETDFPMNAEETSQLFKRFSSQVKLIAKWILVPPGGCEISPGDNVDSINMIL